MSIWRLNEDTDELMEEDYLDSLSVFKLNRPSQNQQEQNQKPDTFINKNKENKIKLNRSKL